MKKSSLKIRIIACALVFLMIFLVSCSADTSVSETEVQAESDVISESPDQTDSSAGFSDEAVFFVPKAKEELVSVKTDSSGKIESVRDKVTLSGYDRLSGDFIEDRTNLSDIENVRGSEQYIQKNGKIYWENNGDTITYEGTGQDDIPVSVNVRYYLDGKNYTLDEITGKEGRVKIIFDYTNNTSGDGYIPFLAMSMIIFDTDRFSNITVNNGTVMNMGYSIAAVGYTVPGLNDNFRLENGESPISGFPEYLEITADTTDFLIDFTTTAVSNGLMENISDDDIASVDELSESMDSLNSAAAKLAAGSGKLLDGVYEFRDAFNLYTNGVKELTDAYSEFEDIIKDLPEYSWIIRSLSDITGNVNEVLDFFISVENLGEWIDALNVAIAKCEESGLPETKAVLEKILLKVTKWQEILDYIGKDKIREYQQILRKGKNVLVLLSEHIDELSENLNRYTDGMNAIKNATPEIQSGFGKLADGITKFAESAKKIGADGTANLAEKAENLSEYSNKMRMMKKADREYDTYSGHPDGTECRVTYLIQTGGS